MSHTTIEVQHLLVTISCTNTKAQHLPGTISCSITKAQDLLRTALHHDQHVGPSSEHVLQITKALLHLLAIKPLYHHHRCIF